MSLLKRDRKVIICDPDKCTGCEICEFVCAAVHHNSFNPYYSNIRRIRIEPILNFALTCQFCKDPPCVRSCPEKALTQDEKTGRIIIDDAKCDGCAHCIKACPFGAIHIDLIDEKARMCDQCKDIEINGQTGPQCVIYCPKEALEFTTLESYSDKVARKSVETLLKSYLE
ncbi:MAG: 4Fe-4S dicluster domain-containing protein [Promethearchaeota archaeon]